MGEPVSYDNVTITGGFWKQRQDTFRKTTIDAVYDRFQETGRFEALKCQWIQGMPNKPHIFWESDVTKWIEGAAYFLKKCADKELEKKIDELIQDMKDSQDDNGYLNEYFTVVEREARFTRRTDHELYCAGHLIEGGIAYAQATGKTTLLEVARKYADLIDRVFRIEHSASFDTPGHEEIELALMKLYHYTKEERYKLLCEYFINTRGTSERDHTYDFTDQEHMQSHLPVRMQKTAEGHSVRALYLYSGMADMAKENKEEELTQSCKTLFNNIVQKRMYITGGIGSTCRGESFTFDYDLPEYTAYNETCASIAMAMFCRRMWLIEADSKYADWAEQALYNTVLAGISLTGDEFFYENPMAVDPARNYFNDSRPNGLKEHLPILSRVKVFDCSCCPPNLLRVVGSIADYMYSTSENTIFAHCYMEGEGTIDLNGQKIYLRQITQYPYSDKIEIITETQGNYNIAVRIPSWAKTYSITINGQVITPSVIAGYAYIERKWESGDDIALTFPMEVQILEANPRVVHLCGRAAVVRGPLVYCVEAKDGNNKSLRDIRISRDSKMKISKESIHNYEFTTIKLQAWSRKQTEELYLDYSLEEEEQEITLIPYFAWSNRGVAEMTVWMLLK